MHASKKGRGSMPVTDKILQGNRTINCHPFPQHCTEAHPKHCCTLFVSPEGMSKTSRAGEPSAVKKSSSKKYTSIEVKHFCSLNYCFCWSDSNCFWSKRLMLASAPFCEYQIRNSHHMVIIILITSDSEALKIWLYCNYSSDSAAFYQLLFPSL